MDRPPLPFTRSSPQQQMYGNTDEARYPPLPPPAYSSQTSLGRRDLPHNDPFFSRRQTYEPHTSSHSPLDQTNSYSFSPTNRYPSSPFAQSSSHGPLGHGERRGSYGSIYNTTDRRDEIDVRAVGDESQRPSNNHSLPPPALVEHGATSKVAYSVDHQRQSSSGQGLSPSGRVHRDHSPPVLPPPPFFGARPMPPPTSPPYSTVQYTTKSSVSRSQPAASSATQLPSLSSLHRPGSSMSISSIIGSDSEMPQREPSSNRISYPNPLIATASLDTNSAQSSNLLQRKESSLPPRSHTPDSHTPWSTVNTHPSRAYSGGASRDQQSSLSTASPDTSRTPHTSQITQLLHNGHLNGSTNDDRHDRHWRQSNPNNEERGNNDTTRSRGIQATETEYGRETSMLDPPIASLAQYALSHEIPKLGPETADQRITTRITSPVKSDTGDTEDLVQRSMHAEKQNPKTSAPTVNYPFLTRPPVQPSGGQEDHRLSEGQGHEKNNDDGYARQVGGTAPNVIDPFSKISRFASLHKWPESERINRFSHFARTTAGQWSPVTVSDSTSTPREPLLGGPNRPNSGQCGRCLQTQRFARPSPRHQSGTTFSSSTSRSRCTSSTARVDHRARRQK